MPTDTVSTAPQRFRAMADALERNAEGSFGGSFVIIPPEGGGEPIETLILDKQQDLAQFWNAVITKCQIMLAKVEMDQRQQGTFNRR